MGYSGYWGILVFAISVLGILISDEISECINMLIVLSFALIPGEINTNKFGPSPNKKWGLF